MLTRLSIRNIVLIEALDLDFARGLGVLTGETGAGKSILLDALGLILGDRAETSLVRAGEDKASVTASFEFSRLPAGIAAEHFRQSGFPIGPESRHHGEGSEALRLGEEMMEPVFLQPIRHGGEFRPADGGLFCALAGEGGQSRPPLRGGTSGTPSPTARSAVIANQ